MRAAFGRLSLGSLTSAISVEDPNRRLGAGHRAWLDCTLRQPGPLPGELQPRFLIKRVYRLLRLLTAFFRLLSELVHITHRPLLLSLVKLTAKH